LVEFKVNNPLGERDITVYDLLTHRSGLATNAANSTFSTPPALGSHLNNAYSAKFNEIFHRSSVPLWSAKVGEKPQYSNLGVATLGYLVEVTNPEKLTFSDYVQKHIIERLGMTSTQFPPIQDSSHIKADIFRRLSTGYARFGPVEIPTPAIYFADYPAGTVVTTPGDHIRLLLALENAGTLNGVTLLKPETVHMMLTPQAKFGTKGKSWVGLVVLMDSPGTPSFHFGHGGGHMWGWSNDSRVYPAQDFALVVATNAWPMVTDIDAFYQPQDLMARFISNWLHVRETDSGQGKSSAPISWAWKSSYVIGLMLLASINELGIDDPIRPEMVDAMARGARESQALGHGLSIWDEAGFRAGVEDLMRVDRSPAGIKGFLRSNRMRVPPEDLELIFMEIEGRRTVNPIAGASDEN
jgi:hypothetical protein